MAHGNSVVGLMVFLQQGILSLTGA